MRIDFIVQIPMGSLVLEDKSDLISWMGMGGFRHSKYTIH